MSIFPGKAKNLITSLTRAMQKTWFGEPNATEQFALPVLANNNEYLPVPNSAVDNYIPMIGVSPGGISHIPIGMPVTYTCLPNSSLGNTRFFVSDSYWRVAAIRFAYKTQGTGSIAINVTKDTLTSSTATAPGSGTPLLATAFNGVTAAANFSQTGTLIPAGSAALYLSPGDSLSVLFTGTLTAIAGVQITVDLVNTCNVTLAGAPAYQPPLQTPIGQSVPSNVSQFYVRLNTETSNQVFFNANRDMDIVAVYATIVTGFAAAITLDITKDTGTQAPGAGGSILAAPMDGTLNNRLLVPALNNTSFRRNMLAGDRLAIKYSATTTGAGLCITVVFAPLYNRLEISIPCGLFAGPTNDTGVQYFFQAFRNYEVVAVSCIYPAVSGSASTLAVTVDKQVQAPGAGTLVQTAFDTTLTANTMQFATLSTLYNRLLSPGDRLGFLPSSPADLPGKTCVTVSLRATS